VSGLIGILRDIPTRTQMIACSFLAKLKIKSAIPEIKTFLREYYYPNVRKAAKNALNYLQDE
jgi:hypothetical protein